MKILLHICCAPCSIYPLKVLDSKGFDVMGYFYRHNIHPFTECEKRRTALATYAAQIGLKVIYQKDYDPKQFLRQVVFRESQRCIYCYHDRLNSAAMIAKRGKFDYFTTTLLYSKFQRHELIQSIGESVAKTHGIRFYYHDFREGWKEGIAESKKRNMYRQQYCGCIYSERERYYPNQDHEKIQTE